MKKDLNFYKKLFTSTFYLSAFTFGGGYVIVPLMKQKFVDELGWIDEEEMLNMIALAQSSPGAIAINASIIVGYKLAGIPGIFVSLLGTILPPLTIISVVAMFYEAFKTNAIVNAVLKGMASGVVAIILSVVFDLGKNIFKEKDLVSILIMFSAFVAKVLFDVNIVIIILACGVLGAINLFYIRNNMGGNE